MVAAIHKYTDTYRQEYELGTLCQ